MKIYIIDKKYGFANSFRKIVERVCEENNIKEITNISCEEGIKALPDNYDLYFIHYNNLADKRPIERLKDKNPKAYLVAIHRGGAELDNKEIKELFNKYYKSFEDCDPLLNEGKYPALEEILKDVLEQG